MKLPKSNLECWRCQETLCMFNACRRYVARVVDGYEPLLPFFDEPSMFPTNAVTAASVTAKTPYNTDWDRDVTEAWFAKVFGKDDGAKYALALLPGDKTAGEPALHVYELEVDRIAEYLEDQFPGDRHLKAKAESIHKAIHRHEKSAQNASDGDRLIKVSGVGVHGDSSTRTLRICTVPIDFSGLTAAICLSLIFGVVGIVLAFTIARANPIEFGICIGIFVVSFILMFVFLYLSHKEKRD